MGTDDYLSVNRANWDDRAPVHARSAGYGLQRFLDDPAFISDVVGFDRRRLGDLTGVRGVHLQCHIGTDTVSLARLGASMTGVDFSPASLAEARALAAGTGDDVRFVESDVYTAPEALGGEQFDLVFTGIGALCWLPTIGRWADVVQRLLRPGGRLFLREGHPMLWALDDVRPDGLLVVEHPYVETEEPMVFEDEGTYVDAEVAIRHSRTHEWNHGLGEIVTALLTRGFELTALEEHDSVPWEALPGYMEPHPDHPGEWRLRDRPWRLPHSYTLRATSAA